MKLKIFLLYLGIFFLGKELDLDSPLEVVGVKEVTYVIDVIEWIFLKEKNYHGYNSKFDTLYQLPPRQVLQPRIDLIEYLSEKTPEDPELTTNSMTHSSSQKKKSKFPSSTRNGFNNISDHKFVRHTIEIGGEDEDEDISVKKKDLWSLVPNITDDNQLYQEFSIRFIEDFVFDYSSPFQGGVNQKILSSRKDKDINEIENILGFPDLQKFHNLMEDFDGWVEKQHLLKKDGVKKEDNQ